MEHVPWVRGLGSAPCSVLDGLRGANSTEQSSTNTEQVPWVRFGLCPMLRARWALRRKFYRPELTEHGTSPMGQIWALPHAPCSIGSEAQILETRAHRTWNMSHGSDLSSAPCSVLDGL